MLTGTAPWDNPRYHQRRHHLVSGHIPREQLLETAQSVGGGSGKVSHPALRGGFPHQSPALQQADQVPLKTIQS